MRLTKIVITKLVIELIGLLCFADGAELKTLQESNRVAIVVNKYLKAEIEDNLNIYLQDLKNEGYEPILKEWDLENDPAPRMLKEYLQGLYWEEGGLQGAVFIGDLPIPRIKTNPLLKEDRNGSRIYIQISDTYIAERYYMDLIGKEWTNEDEIYKLDVYREKFLNEANLTPQILQEAIKNEQLYPMPEIWTSRIITSTLTGLFRKSEGQLVNAYLEKNHAYRTKQVEFQKQALMYTSDPSQNDKAFNRDLTNSIKQLLSDKYVVKEPAAPDLIYLFFRYLDNQSFEILYWERHGLPTSINLGYEELSSWQLAETTTKVSTAFIFPISCLIGEYTEPEYFAGSYLFNEQFYALSMPTLTLPAFRGTEISIIREFINGNNLGLSFKKAIELPDLMTFKLDAKYFESNIASLNSRYILGDGTLKLQSWKFDDTTMFKRAIEAGTLNLVIFLIKNGAKINTKDGSGSTPLHHAVKRKNNMRVIDQLIEHGANLTAKNNYGQTPWDIAKENNYDRAILDAIIKYGTVEDLKFLIANGANMDLEGMEGQRFLGAALYNKPNLKIAKFLIENGADVNFKDSEGTTLLLDAAATGNFEIVKFLIENGADVNVKNISGVTPLHDATMSGNNKTIKLLIKNGADVNAKNDDGETPWDVARYGNNPEVLEVLKNTKAKTTKIEL